MTATAGATGSTWAPRDQATPPGNPGRTAAACPATLLSNGQAFNDLDARTGGVWTLDGNTVVIDWISGWRTTMSINPATPLQLRHWAPGADRKGPETSGVRQGKRVE